jgi:hypothetical protein
MVAGNKARGIRMDRYVTFEETLIRVLKEKTLDTGNGSFCPQITNGKI